MIVSADTNLFLYAANPASPRHPAARAFFETMSERGSVTFVLCGLVLIEVYMQLRNPAVFAPPRSPAEAATFCAALRSNPAWEYVDYEPEVGTALWRWAADTDVGFRRIIDARLALTLRHHGVTHFATANVKDFAEFDFERVWNPVEA